jgi:23S rRNA (cytidine2498-2'-O)-methyltransferase
MGKRANRCKVFVVSANVSDSSMYVYATCQIGAERALKNEIARDWPVLRFAFSRPGFLTFKLVPQASLPENWNEKLVFARAAGQCIGKVEGNTTEDRVHAVWKLLEAIPTVELHVWSRDRFTPGYREYEPGITPEALEVARLLNDHKSNAIESLRSDSATSGTSCEPTRFSDRIGSRSENEAPIVADVVVVDPNEWWVGFHRARTAASKSPGGFSTARIPEFAVSRAWLKMEEAVSWSGFSLEPGQSCVEIGSAPGGASQYLLSRGLKVIGVDPAKMAPPVVADKNFRHIRKRSKEVSRSEFLGVDWLTCDVNLPPNYTLDTVRAIVAHPGVRFRGLLLTLKLVEWSLADEIPRYLAKIRDWGFRNVMARQLHHNRQEICVAASQFKVPRQAIKKIARPQKPKTRIMKSQNRAAPAKASARTSGKKRMTPKK